MDPPTPDPSVAAACEALVKGLPETLDGAGRVDSAPASPYVAVWGEGEIALRCGVPRPVNMAATDQVPVINDVAWFSAPSLPTLFTSVGRQAYVEVTISRAHTPEKVLVDLAAPIKAALPQTG
ncbi:DUF3515 domain-containing protein [Planobispora rosea]|uniref:DUF3515 domain-containing protein n=1 Tax=Planobispora rosea TaxID=35762 RepID=UPI001FCFA080|nr:DUF3515 domain-containing protein [Planobispora rosea]